MELLILLIPAAIIITIIAKLMILYANPSLKLR